MHDKQDNIAIAVERLNNILPLSSNQRTLTEPLQQLYRAVLNSYVVHGRSLTREEMALQVNDIDDAISTLKQKNLVVFSHNDEPIGAYPFTMEERDHQVTVNGHTVHCMCALDALAVSPMFKLPTLIHSRCHVTSEPVAIQQDGFSVHNNDKDIYFGINWSAASADSCCADSLCTEMLFLKDQAVAEDWVNESPEQSEIFTLAEAIQFASRFFMPLMSNKI